MPLEPTLPEPGTDEARELGCTCKPIPGARKRANGKGFVRHIGAYEDDKVEVYWYHKNCPLHGDLFRMGIVKDEEDHPGVGRKP